MTGRYRPEADFYVVQLALGSAAESVKSQPSNPLRQEKEDVVHAMRHQFHYV